MKKIHCSSAALVFAVVVEYLQIATVESSKHPVDSVINLNHV
jgi:hypothetical protein